MLSLIGPPAKRRADDMTPLSGIWILSTEKITRQTLTELDPVWQNFLDLRVLVYRCSQFVAMFLSSSFNMVGVQLQRAVLSR